MKAGDPQSNVAMIGAGMVEWIKGLSPYQSLALLAVPLAIIEPLKLVAIFVAGDGHWFTGVVVELAAYGVSIFVIDRLFRIVKPKLLMIAWLNRFWTWSCNMRSRIRERFTAGR